MSIIQISRIQHRSGNLIDLPQLAEAELGWASDAKLLFIGKTDPNENVEVLTSYSNINLSQIEGSDNNNLNIVNSEDGQVLAIETSGLGNFVVNRGGNAGGLLNLGNIANVKIQGGSAGYVIETDGFGNLNWTPKSSIVAFISNVTQANPGVVTTTEENFLASGAEITITQVDGMTELNGNSYYVSILTSNTFALYTDSALTVTLDTTGFGAYTGNGRVVSAIGSSTGTAAAGSAGMIQYNQAGILAGSANLTFDGANVVVGGGVTSSGQVQGTILLSTVSIGTPPLNVISTTPVPNLHVSLANNVSNSSQPNITSLGTLSNLSVSGNINGGGILSVTGNITGGNLISSGSISSVANVVAGNLLTTGFISAGGNITGLNLAIASNVSTGNLNTSSNISTGNLSFTGQILSSGNINVGNVSATTGAFTNISGNLTTNTQSNITTIGTLTNLTVSGTTTSGNLNVTSSATTPTVAVATDNTTVATTAFVHDILPYGVILMWSGSIASIPSGWALCNGTLGTPDLRDRFIVGAGSTYAVAATGGSANAIVVSHNHTFSGSTGANGQHEHLTGIVAELNPFGSNIARYGYGSAWSGVRQSYASPSTGYDTFTDTETSHVHSFSGTTSSTGSSSLNANLPPYYALAYIMKITG